jgi:hypothetical protein
VQSPYSHADQWHRELTALNPKILLATRDPAATFTPVNAPEKEFQSKPRLALNA